MTTNPPAAEMDEMSNDELAAAFEAIMIDEDSTLKPCPFCGSANVEERVGVGSVQWFDCLDCSANAGENWNSRPIEYALAARALRNEAFALQLSRLLYDHPEINGELYDGPCECRECRD